MDNLQRCLLAASALARHLEGRGTTTDELSDAFLAEAIGASNAVRGRLATAERLRFLADYLEASIEH
ncbi:hypothetical protein [Mesorhizobium sp. YM1C-6-2]|uniref:hypothetical protein n=1 Tax=Mesorhizobium sp. YM1C-6-2 TaxID=1827501 RepID=UPI001603B3C5|nr:hypothetical protein [Mesorhizobium sp. YM1C-6-2]